MSDPDVQRRGARRYPKPGLVWYRAVPSQGQTPIEGVGSSLNVSRSGVAFIASTTVEVGALLLVHIRSRGLQVTGLMRVARVRAREDGQFEVGVHIEAIPPDHRAILEQLFL